MDESEKLIEKAVKLLEEYDFGHVSVYVEDAIESLYMALRLIRS